MIRKIVFSLGLLCIATFYLHQWIIPGLAFHEQHIGFYTDSVFFSGYTNFPGGPAEYAATFIMQFFYYNMAASLLVPFFGILSGLLVNTIIQKVFRLRFFYHNILITTGLYISLHSVYHLHFFVTFVVFIAWLFVYLYLLLPKNKFRFLLGIPFAIFLYYLSGPMALYIFLASCLSIEILYGKPLFRITKGVVLPAMAFAIPYLGFKYFFLINQHDAFLRIFVIDAFILRENFWILYFLYACLPLTIILSAIYAVFRKKISKKTKQKKARIQQLVSFALVIILIVFLAYSNYNKQMRDVALVKQLAYEAQWDQVIEKALETDYYHYFINLEYNRALAHRGRLLEQLFNYPQMHGVKSVAPDGYDNIVAMPIITDLYYDLAYIEAARRWADEVITYVVNSPRSMETLIKSTLIKGEYPLSEKYIAKYSNNFLFTKKAERFKQMLTDSANITSKYPEIAQKRKYMPRDSVFTNITSYMLKSLFKKNHNNRFATEYLMANYLLKKDFSNFLPLYNQLRKQYKKPPRVCEEALVMRATMTRDTSMIKHFNISKNAFLRFVKFGKTMKQYQDKNAAKNALQNYADTYWYYYFFINATEQEKQAAKKY